MSVNFDALDAAVQHALGVAGSAPDGLVAALNKVDAVLDSAGEDTAAFEGRVVELALAPLLADVKLLKKFNFAASLVSGPQSHFMRAILTACVGEFSILNLVVALAVVESCRRNRLYDQMEDCVTLFLEKMAPADWLSWHLLNYEISMARYQQAEAIGNPESAEAQQLYRDGLEYAEQAARDALKAGNVLDSLFASMNITGLFLPRLGQWEEAIRRSEQVSEEAERQYALATDDTTRSRAKRVAMNAALHRITIGAEHDVPVEDMRRWLGILLENPIYLAAKDQDWAKDGVRTAEEYIAKKS